MTKNSIEWAKERAAEAQSRSAAGVMRATVLLPLPLWPDAVRAVPNGFLRSALFGAIAKGKRRYIGVSSRNGKICTLSRLQRP